MKASKAGAAAAVYAEPPFTTLTPAGLFDELAAKLRGIARLKRRDRRRLVAAMVWGDLLIILATIAGWSATYVPDRLGLNHTILLSALVLPTYLFAAWQTGAYRLRVDSKLSVPIAEPASALVAAVAGLLMLIFLTQVRVLSRVVVVGTVVLGLVALILFRSLLDRQVKRQGAKSRFATLCIYDGVPCREDKDFTRIAADKYGLSADASDPDMIARLSELSKEFDRLVIYCEPDHRKTWAFVLKSLSVPSEIAMAELTPLNPLGVNRRSNGITLTINSGPLFLYQRITKRLFDLTVTLLAMPVVLPILAITAIAIKLDNKGPVFFMQDRIGLDNRPFRIFKFRSMRTDLLDLDGIQSTQRGDPRITRLGAFLRKSSLDELPQMLNVLIGDMSIVGPRPHARLSRAGERLFWEVDNAYWHRHAVKPGITGLAQVRGHRGNTFQEEHLQLRLNSDLEYVANWSLMQDLLIILMTFRVLVHKNAF